MENFIGAVATTCHDRFLRNSVILKWQLVFCSVRLVYPPSRDFNDELDNSNSDPPCGVYSESSSPVTNLAAGSTLNVSWSLTYPHTGGFKIQLLAPVSSFTSSNALATETLTIEAENHTILERYLVKTLTSETSDNWGILANPTAQWASVNLPREVCSGCTIRLLRQAFNINPNGDLFYWSCSDVNIVYSGVNLCQNCNNNSAPCDFEQTGNNGEWKCECDSALLMSGPYCERTEECSSDIDCGPLHGKCIDIGSTNSPSRQCYCESGWTGTGCQNPSNLTMDASEDISKWGLEYPFNYTTTNFSLFWKILPPGTGSESADSRQIEVAMAANTTSYVAVGWRPANLPYERIPHSVPASASSAPRQTAVRTAEARERRLSENAESPRSSAAESPTRSPVHPSPSPKASPVPSGAPESPTESQDSLADSPAESPADFTATVEVRQDPSTLSGEMPGMYAQDLTVGFARGSFHRVQDSWSLPGSHATPIPDVILGGQDDVLDSIGQEFPDGTTVIKFRRPFVPSDNEFDYTLNTDEDFTVVFAYGQSPGNADQSMLASSAVTLAYQEEIQQFYREDEMKYHGQKKAGVVGKLNLGLGVPTIDVHTCTNSSLIGYSCQVALTGDNFLLHWALTPELLVNFAAERKSQQSQGWISVGFAPAGVAYGSQVVLAVLGALPSSTQNATLGTYSIANNTREGLVPLTPNDLLLVNSSVASAQNGTILRFAVNYSDPRNSVVRLGANKTTNVVWAFSEGNEPLLANHFISGRGMVAVNFVTGESSVVVSPLSNWLTLHAVMMTVCFAVVLPLANIYARFSQVKPTEKQACYATLHTVFAVAGTVLAGIAAYFGFQDLSETSWNFHGTLGTVLLAALALVWIHTILFRPFAQSDGEARHTGPAKLWSVLHKFLGVGLTCAAAVVSYFGICDYQNLTGNNATGYFAGYGGCLLLLSLFWLALQFAMPAGKPRGRPVAEEVDAVTLSKSKKDTIRGDWPPPGVRWPPTPTRSAETAEN